MNVMGWLQILVYFVVLLLCVKPLGSYMARVFQGERTFLSPVLSPLEKFLYRLSGVKAEEEMDWKAYTIAVLVFNFIGILVLFVLQIFQGFLPLNPLGLGAVAPDLAFNTAVSFVTNTNWQNYAGESTMSYLTQMMGLTVQNFFSAATGIAVLLAFIRGLARHKTKFLGNFWVDFTRTTLYVLLPLSIILAVILVSQGVVQTFSTSVTANLIQPVTDGNNQPVTTQSIAVGPVASQVAIKHLGTNGGGFFNANAAHPFENPTPFTDFILILSETVLAASLTFTFGKMVGDTRQGWAILAVMLILVFFFSGFAYAFESASNPKFAAMGVDQSASELQPGGNMEGKEIRFGIPRSALFATMTTATSTGAVDSMHDSFTPLGGLVLLVMMMLGEVALGGVGSGLYGMLVFVIIAVFVAGLMVGRTPEYLGKKIEAFEMKMASLLIIIMPLTLLGLTAVAVSTSSGQLGPLNSGPHGFSEILYAITSQTNNNGSAFAGLSGNTLFYNMIGVLAMLIGRFGLIVPTMALAGSLAGKKIVPSGAGTLSTTSILFMVWLIGIVLLVGALNFIPALALGPIVENILARGI